MDVKHVSTFSTSEDAEEVFNMMLTLRRLGFCIAVARNMGIVVTDQFSKTVCVWT